MPETRDRDDGETAPPRRADRPPDLCHRVVIDSARGVYADALIAADMAAAEPETETDPRRRAAQYLPR